ncbi:MAG: ABC transporter permease [Clostridiales Family XIII bacterium]|jgi:rhamnose transport system permease protein|nr:ABC transporter permease [Clostridiales Family XIII bacterium]
MANQRTNVELDRLALDQKFNARKFFLKWEWLLVVILLAILGVNISASGGSFLGPQFFGSTNNFMDKSFLVLSMTFVIILGEIDISVGSTVALSSVLMAVAYNAGLPMGASLVLCLLVGTLCGFINGVIATKFKELPTMIITLATMIIYRGIANILLEDRAAGGFPDWFQNISWGTVGPVPYSLIAFLVFAVVFGIVLHKTRFGRELYAGGNNRIASLFSRVKVDRNLLIAFTLNGVMAGVCALFLTSRMTSTRPNVASGYELEAIAMVVLAGVPAIGGKGNISGVILSVFIIGYLRYGLGLFNVTAPVMSIIIGLLLVGSVLISNFFLNREKKLKVR